MSIERLEGDRVVVAQTSIAVSDVRSHLPGAGHVLALCCYLAADDIPRRLLLNGPRVLPEELTESMRDPVALIQAAATISRYGLIRIDGDAFSIHRRLQATLRDGLGPEEQRVWAAWAGRVVLAAFPDRPEVSHHWTWAARLVPHALAANEHMAAQELEPVLRVQLLDRVARYLLPQGQLDVASELLKRALAILEAGQPEDALYASVLNHFSIAQRESGHFNAARRDARRALAIHRASLGGPPLDLRPPPDTTTRSSAEADALEGVNVDLPAHPEIADDLRNLGVIAMQRGELNEAFLHIKQVYEMRVLIDGEHGPLVAEALFDLFNVALEAGRYKDAISILSRAIEIQEEEYGPTEDEVVVNRQVLSILTASQDSDLMAREVVALQEARFGPRHPEVAAASRLLAALLTQLGEFVEARRMEEKALDIDRDNFGIVHFNIGLGSANLMSIEAQDGNLAGAASYLHQVVDVVLAAPSGERVTTLRLSGLNRRLAEVATSEEARRLVPHAEAILDAAFADDESVLEASRELVASAFLLAGDTLLVAGRTDEAEVQYGEGIRLARLTTENPLDDADFLLRLGVLAAARDRERSEHYLRESMECLGEGGLRYPIWTLLGLVSRLYHLLARPSLLAEVVDALYDHTMDGGSMEVFRGEIAVTVPENWFAKESTTLLAPDGQANVIFSNEPLDPTVSLESYAGIQGDLLQSEFPEYVERSYEMATVLGDRQGYVRHFEWKPPDGVQVTQIQLYYVENARGYTATATTPSEGFSERELVLRQALRGLRLIRG